MRQSHNEAGVTEKKKVTMRQRLQWNNKSQWDKKSLSYETKSYNETKIHWALRQIVTMRQMSQCDKKSVR